MSTYDITPHLAEIVGEIVDRLTLAEIGISSLLCYPRPGEVTIHPLPGMPSIGDARRIVEIVGASADKVKVGDPYGDPPQVNVEAIVTLAGQPLRILVIANPDPR